MFTKPEFKAFIAEILRRYFLPDALNKATFVTLGAGVAVVTFPTPFKVLVINWIIQTIGLNLPTVTLAQMSNGAADYALGAFLITVALVYNLIGRAFQLRSDAKADEKARVTRDADRQLFAQFMAVLPTSSPAIRFLREHDLADSFRLEVLADFDKFTWSWGEPEKRFLTERLDEKREELLNKGKEFQAFLALKTGPTMTMRQSVVPDHLNDDWNLPQNFRDDIAQGNKIATEFVKLHEEFIITAKQELLC